MNYIYDNDETNMMYKILDDSILDELDDVDEVVDDVEVEEVNVVNDDFNIDIVSVKVVAITKAKLKAIAKVVNPVDDPVVEIVHEKRRGRPTIEIQKIYDFTKILIFYILNLKRTSQLNEINKKNFYIFT
jgi:hypothetical protein